MTTTQLKRNEALNISETLKNHSRFTKETIAKEFSVLNNQTIKELKYSKDLRNVEVITRNLLLRHYYKQLYKMAK